MKRLIPSLLCAFALAAPVLGQSVDSSRPGYFVVDVVGERFTVYITNPAAAAKARDILAGRAPQQIVTGNLAYGNAGFNFDGNLCYSWHMDPATVSFAEFTVELCHGRPLSDVEADATYWVKRVGYYCTWSGRLVAEIPPPKYPDCKIGI